MKAKINQYQYAALVPAIAAYRGYLMQYAGIKSGNDYLRIYTDRRVAGARSKFWGSTFDKKQIKRVKAYIKEYPVVYVWKDQKTIKEYAVRFEPVKNSRSFAFGYEPNDPDYQLIFTAI